MKAVRVLGPGLLTTVQDRGRIGYRSTGIPRAGAMDVESLEIANLIVGNEPGEACLECTVAGPSLEFEDEAVVALAGGEVEATLDGRAVPTFSRLFVRRGAVLDLGRIGRGPRAYIAIRGGFDLPLVMGSRSTSLQAGFGGFRGRQLRTGDRMDLREPATVVPPGDSFELPLPLRPAVPTPLVLRILPSCEFGRFASGASDLVVSSDWTVSILSDRMGMRFEGPEIAHGKRADILSSGVLPGTIQVPGDGMPVLLAADCQTTGGYVRIAQVCGADLPVTGRLAPGDSLRFGYVNREEAIRLLAESAERLRSIRDIVASGSGSGSGSRSGGWTDRSPAPGAAAGNRGIAGGQERYSWRLTVDGSEYLVDVESVG